MMYRFFALLRRFWSACGEPFPGLARSIRHKLFGRKWPVQPPTPLPPPTPTPGPAAYPLYALNPLPRDTAVIIPCHNYGRYLREAIDSVLEQTVKPVDIVVVDDASDDDSAAIAKEYASKGVRLLQVQFRSLALTRNAGIQSTRSTFIVSIDADDRLPPDYIERCVGVMDNPRIAVAYGDRSEFGERTQYLSAPDFSEDILLRYNFIPASSLIRRQAFDLAGGYRQIDGSLEDWDFYRRLVAMGFTARHAGTFVQYRMHKQSMGYLLKKDPLYSYARIAALKNYPVTIFTPFAGRDTVFDRYLEGLLSLDYDPSLIRLHWYNTSADPVFDAQLRTAMQSLPFGRITYTHSPLPPLWNHTPESLIRMRIEDPVETDYYYQLAVVRAYNDMIQSCDTEYVLTLEDDMHVNPDTLLTLQNAMQYETVAAVAPYKSGFFPRYEIWQKGPAGTVRCYPTKQSGIMDIGGSGFGCALFRTFALRSIAPIYTGVRGIPQQWYDQLTYLRLASLGRIVCNWDAEVEHMHTERYKEKLPQTWT